MILQLAYFDRGRDPVVMDLGPVLDLEDVMGGKVCALASRVEPRDYADVAATLQRYSPAQLIGFARRRIRA
jgi:predicted nucleotidyltransferase component of viral defense system